jgi:hypothetical protein
MRQGESIIREALAQGLRRFPTNPRGINSLVECHNLAPAEQGLEPHEEVTDLNAIDIPWGGEGRVIDYIDEDLIETDEVIF